MGAEDFAYYAQRVPACIARLGLGRGNGEPDQNPCLHNPKFDFNDEAIPVGMRVLCELALRAGELDID
jgi:metal-dependent amidase/aminoacylase/carboxypeptidase family protein